MSNINYPDQVTGTSFCKKLAASTKKLVCTKSFALGIALGQLLSLLICGTAVTSGLLQEASVNIPTGQSLINYVLLAVIFNIWTFLRVGLSGVACILKDRGIKYIILAIIEVEANFLIIKAYQFTSVTSVQLLDCLAIPTVLILSRKCLKVHFKWQNYTGVVICLLGAGLLVLADVLTGRYTDSGHSDSVTQNLIGDALCVLGAILYGILNVSQEFVISKHGSVEYLGMVGCFASVISLIQFLVLERQEFLKIEFGSLNVWLPFVMFVLCMFSFYCLMSYTLNKTSAMVVNLNLLSSDFFSLLVGIYVFKYKFHVLYFGSFSIIIIGVLLYNIQPATRSEVLPDLPSIISVDAEGGVDEHCLYEPLDGQDGGEAFANPMEVKTEEIRSHL